MIDQILGDAKNVAIGGHVRPDGDCVGSCMALAEYIRKWYPECNVDVYLEEIAEEYKCIVGTDQIIHEIPETCYDLFICLDCGDEDRLGFSGKLFEDAKRSYCIDHHISNTAFADDSYIVPDASSTAELVYHVMEDKKITIEIATALYLGIVHDTGVFQYSCAKPSTFRVAAKLLEKGVDAPTLITDTYYEKTYIQNRMLGIALNKSRLHEGGKVISSVITTKEMEELQANPKDLDAIVSQLRITKGVEVAIFLYQTGENSYKISLRAKDYVDVSKVAVTFGGGGHIKASGASMDGTSEEVIEKLLKELKTQLRD